MSKGTFFIEGNKLFFIQQQQFWNTNFSWARNITISRPIAYSVKRLVQQQILDVYQTRYGPSKILPKVQTPLHKPDLLILPSSFAYKWKALNQPPTNAELSMVDAQNSSRFE